MKQIIDHLSQQAVREYAQIVLSHRPQKPKLILPKNTYFSPGGQDVLACDVAKELFKNPRHFQIAHKKITDSYTLQKGTFDTVQIILNNDLRKTPHLEAFMICRATIHVQLNALLPGIVFQHDAIEKLINALLIKNGLGIFAINASEELHANNLKGVTPDQTLAILKNVATLDTSFRAFCKQHRITPKTFCSYLLPDARKRLAPHNTNEPSQKFVSEYQKNTLKKQLARRFNALTFIMFILAIIVIGYFGLATFSRNLQPKKQEIESSRFDLYDCIQELETMISIVETQDIYTLRSIAGKRKSCEALRVQHNQLVLKYTKQ